MPATAIQIASLLYDWSLIFGQGTIDERGAQRKVALYARYFEGFSFEVLRAAGDRYCIDGENKFFPTPGMILEEADNVIHNVPTKREIEEAEILHKAGLKADWEWRKHLRHYQESKFWVRETWGPEPPNLGCRAPEHVLVEFGYRTSKEPA